MPAAPLDKHGANAKVERSAMRSRSTAAVLLCASVGMMAGCGAGTSAEESATPTISASTGGAACLVTDLGGVDDQSFNQNSYAGVTRAASTFGLEPVVLESTTESDYARNLTTFIDQGCRVIISVGYLLADATEAAANANPQVPFSIVDYAYPPGRIAANNVLGQVFRSDQAAFLAGYLAAGMSTSGTVGTFGGMYLPTVTAFMDGFAAGVARYNADTGASVQLVGWDPLTRTGVFTGDFVDTDAGRSAAQDLVDSSADIIMPVAGLAGTGAAALAGELGRERLAIIGVDSDQYETDPDHRDVYLTSVLKNSDITTYDAIAQVVDGNFTGGTVEGTLANGGVGLAPFHAFADDVPPDLVARMESLKAGIADGTVSVAPDAP